MSKSTETLDAGLCRACLSRDTRMEDIFSTGLYPVLEQLINTSVSAGDGLPHSVCWLCAALLRKTRSLRDTALAADRLLRQRTDEKTVSEDIKGWGLTNSFSRSKLEVSSYPLWVEVKQETSCDDHFINDAEDLDSKLQEIETVVVKIEPIWKTEYPESDEGFNINQDPADITDSSKNMTEIKEKICFICGLAGDPINNKLKNLSSTILNNCINAIEIRKASQSARARKYFDVSTIELPNDLEEKGYHQQCYKQLTNLSGKRKLKENDTSQSNEELDRRLKKTKTSAERGKEFRERKALIKQMQQTDDLVETDMQSVCPSVNRTVEKGQVRRSDEAVERDKREWE